MITHEKIILLGPKNKKGATINKDRYDAITDLIINSLNSHPEGEIGFYELMEEARENLPHVFQVDMPWYLLQVKIDLQQRQIIKVLVDKSRKQTIQIIRTPRQRLGVWSSAIN